MEDITGNVQEIVDRVRNKPINSTMDCCGYRHQILDTFCATQPAVCTVICMYNNVFITASL